MSPGVGGTAPQAQDGLSGRRWKGLEHLLQYETLEESAQVQPYVLAGETNGLFLLVQFPGPGFRRPGGGIGRYVEPAPRGFAEGLAELQDQEKFLVARGVFQRCLPVDPGQKAVGMEPVVSRIGLADQRFHVFAPGTGFPLSAAGEQQFTVRVHAGKPGV